MYAAPHLLTPGFYPPEEKPGRGDCHICGYQNLEYMGLCLNCLAPLVPSCPACAQTVAAGSRFCSRCGIRLDSGPPAYPGLSPVNRPLQLPAALAQKIRAAALKPAGERRDVTILCAELSGLSGLPDTEAVYHAFNKAISRLIEVVYTYEGTLDKITGAGLVAYFGAPVAYENAAERAVRAGLDMLDALHPNRQEDLHLRIGINTGPVIAGRMGSRLHMEYTVTGRAVKVAGRLAAAAGPNTILVGVETCRRTRSLFRFEAATSLPPDDLPPDFQAFWVTGPVQKPAAGRDLPHFPAPMVGRSKELARLQSAMDAVRRGQGRIVQVTGEAGIGKSRLVAEFRRSLVRSDARIYRGVCPAYPRTRPLAVAAGIVRDLLALTETTPPDVQAERLYRHLDQLDGPARELWPFLLHLLGLAHTHPEAKARLSLLDGAMFQRQTHTALRHVLLAETRVAPTVLIFEDLHLADPASLAFLHYLIQSTADVPYLLVLVARHAEADAAIRPLLAAAGQQPGRLVDLPLRPLSPPDRQALVNHYIHQTTPQARTVKNNIAARSEGNPFFIEEFIRMLIDHGGLVQDEAGPDWQVTAAAGQLLGMVPGTIKDLILARIDRLPEAVRQTLQTASVLGAAFPAGLLQALHQPGAGILDVHLSRLEQRHFLQRRPFEAEPGYRFRHILLQETVYSTLLAHNRGRLHFEAGRAIEQRHSWPPGGRAAALAYHYARSNSPAKAVPYLLNAAGEAARQGAFETAVEQYRRAVELLPARPDGESETFFQARIGLGRSLKYVGALAEAEQVLAKAMQLLWSSGLATNVAALRPVLVELLRQLAGIREQAGRYNEALEYLETGLQLLGRAATRQNPRLYYALVAQQAGVLFRQGQPDRAAELAESAVQGLAAVNVDDPVLQARVFNTLGRIFGQRGHHNRAIEYVRRSLELYNRLGYRWGVGTACHNLGLLNAALGNWPAAADDYEQAYTLQESIGDIAGQARSLISRGMLAIGMGRRDEAGKKLVAGLNLCQKLDDRFEMARAYAGLSQLALLQGRPDEAADHAQAALSLADAIAAPEIQVETRRLSALIRAEQDDPRMGLEIAGEGLEMARAAGLVEGEIDCLQAMGELNTRLEQAGPAEKALTAAASLAADRNDPYRQGRALLALARLYQTPARENRAAAIDALSQAVSLFEKLGAADDLQQAQQALNRLQAGSAPQQ